MTSLPILCLLLLLPTMGVRAEGAETTDEGSEAVKKAYENEGSAQPPQTAESEDEKQVRMNEESKQMELELVRAD